MSAFCVSPWHIDYLVAAIKTYGPPAELQYDGRPVQAMSGAEIGQVLADVNVKSVGYRYEPILHEDGRAGLPVPVDRSRLDRYTPEPPVIELRPEQVVKAASCFMYQSCDHPEWRGSAEEKLIEDLIELAERHIPEKMLVVVTDQWGTKYPKYRTTNYYDELEWEIWEDAAMPVQPDTMKGATNARW